MTFDSVVIIEGHEENIAVHHDNLFCGPMRIGDIEIFERKLLVSRTPYVLAQVETVMPRETIRGKAMMYKKGYCIFVAKKHTRLSINLKKVDESYDYGTEYTTDSIIDIEDFEGTDITTKYWERY